MKLSDLFTNLADGARTMETRVKKWQEELEAKNSDMMESARRWQADAANRQEDLQKKIQGYLDDASENVRSQWGQMQKGWEEQVAQTRAKAEEMRAKAAAMNAEDNADWFEAYAATMVNFAQKMQDEASNAVAAATEARAKAENLKKDV
ncbi:hypothetical protein PE067_05785 [Paracoccus sp. DMF-8]|uniref:hypothetical protein n=1 Tax=Paracoccus sp. DMF-8 TaxID=3019445 RepID=UPI0023E7DCCA|nr:hypothetical protein [Paracoccus sp. DMF-8]MDF3605702.1 hypothetical protein [Paracoccus sp. DMF-8]